jgi:two-component system NarL family sensor kinase
VTGLVLAGPARRSFAPSTVAGTLGVVGCLTALVVGLACGESARDSGYFVVDVVQAVVFPLVALVLVTSRPRHPAGWLLMLVGAAHAAAIGAEGWYLVSLPGSTAALWTESWVWFVGFGVLVALVPLVVADGVPGGRRRLLWRAALTLTAATTVGLALVARLNTGPHTSVANPIALPGADAAVAVLIVVWGVSGLLALGDLVLRWWRAEEDERRRLMPVLAAYVLVGLGLVVASFLPHDEPLIQALTLPCVAVGIAVAVLRYHLFDIEAVLRRSLTYLLLTAGLLAVYSAVVFAVRALLADRAAWAGSVVATGLVAVVFTPARAAVQRLLSRSLFGDRDDPSVAMTRLVNRLQATTAPGRALAGVVETLAASLRLPYAALVDGSGGLLAEVGVRPGGALVGFPMPGSDADGPSEGVVQVAERVPGERFSTADQSLLIELAGACAVAVRADRLAREVQRSRKALVVAREEERRRLRRDLHDQLGPAIASVRVQLDVVAALLESRPEAAAPVLAEVRATAGQVVGDLRALITGLRPPALDDIGLLEAVRELARRLSHPAVVIEVTQAGTFGEVADLPAAVEVAAFRIAAEAMHNAVRHSGATRITVCVAVSDQVLEVIVTDDGCGLPSGPTAGLGLRSMRERADEVGGRFDLLPPSEHDGLQVRAALPLAAVETDLR